MQMVQLRYNYNMGTVLTHTISVLGVAVIVAIIARRMHLPYTVGLVVTGIGLAVVGLEPGAMLTHYFIFEIILPPLLFEAALSIRWRELRQDMLPVVVLSTLGVVISAVVVAAGMVTFLAWPAAPAVVFGVLIAATDPIAVLAMFKDTGIKGRLRLLVESESLFNDGVAAVFFALVLTWAQATASSQLSTVAVVRSLAFMTGGGILVGVTCGAAAVALAGRTSDHLVQATLTAVAAYGSFLLAEHSQFSGVLATVAAGLLMGNLGVLSEDENRSVVSPDGRSFVIDLWEFVAFIANSLIFLFDWSECHASYPCRREGSVACNRPGSCGACADGLSGMFVLSAFGMGHTPSRAARPVVGWTARSAGIGISPFPSALLPAPP